MQTRIRTAWACMALGLPLLTAGAMERDRTLAYEELAAHFREAHGVSATDPSECDLGALIDEHHARIRLGALDVRFPAAALEEKHNGRDFQDVCLTLLDLQELWLDWFDVDSEENDQARRHLKTVRGWVKGWRPGTLAAQIKSGEREVPVLLAAREKIVEALDGLAELMGSGAAMGLDLGERQPQPLVFCPGRGGMLEFACFVGWLDEGNRGIYWNEGLLYWTDFWWRGIQVVALEYPMTSPDPQTYGLGKGMNEDEKTGLVQHVAQRGSIAFTAHVFGNRLVPAIELGLAQNAVIALYGVNNTRSGGSTRGNETHEREVFIPGGLSEGGLLPPLDAESRWREKGGQDYFVGVVRVSQKAGAKRAGRREDPLVHLEITSNDTSERHLVRAPFLGEHAGMHGAPPAQAMTDYREFFRAYKSAFAHWLQTAAGGSKKKSAGKLAELLAAAGGLDEEAAPEQAFQEVYGIPLSAASGETESLEWEFLAWLEKQ